MDASGRPALGGAWTSGVAENCALLVAGGAVVELGGDLLEVGDVVFGGHGNGTGPEELEGGVAGEDAGVLGVDVEEVELAGAGEEGGFDAAEELAQEGGFEGVEEVEEGGGVGEGNFEGVAAEEGDGGEEFGGSVAEGGRGLSEREVVFGDGG